MSKKSFKSQASSSRAASGAFGGFSDTAYRFGASSGLSGVSSSQLSYIYEPPDLALLSDPNIGVAFKNVQKKDSTTKARGLEDLQACLKSLEADSWEDAVLEAWIKVYPRTSIDNSRRVRQLAHTLQGQIAFAYGKRLARHMPTVTPSWLAGIEDPDKSVSRAAQESFNGVFSTNEKSLGVWRMYQTAIVQYLLDLVTKESENTLSDERTTSPEDAVMKYVRTIGCGVMIVTKLLMTSQPADREKSEASWATLFSEKGLWKLAGHSDAFVRRAVYRLLVNCLETHENILDPALLSSNVLTNGLHTHQLNSSTDYIKAIAKLTQKMPTVWTEHYIGTGKKSALNRLSSFLRKGSCGGPPDFWDHLPGLFLQLTKGHLFNTFTGDSDKEKVNDSKTAQILEALREGINCKNEPRLNLFPAWNAYLDICKIFITIEDPRGIPTLLRDSILPLAIHSIKLGGKFAERTIAGQQQQEISTRACLQILEASKEIFYEEWQTMSSMIVEDIQTSLPEQSKEYTNSQESVAGDVKRWYNLQGNLIRKDRSNVAFQTIQKSAPKEIISIISTLKNRNGKPFSAAVALESSVQAISAIILGNAQTKDALAHFMQDDLCHLLLSQSASNLIAALDHIKDEVDVHQAVSSCVQELEKSSASDAKQKAMKSLIASASFARVGQLSLETSEMLREILERAIADDDEMSWNLVMTALSNPSAPNEFTDNVLARLTEALSVEETSLTGLHGLEKAAAGDENLIKAFIVRSKDTNLLTSLLQLSDRADDDASSVAKRLAFLTETALKVDGKDTAARSPVLSMVRKELSMASRSSLPIHLLIDQVRKLLDPEPKSNISELLSEIVPDEAQWKTAFEPLASISPNHSLAITNIFGCSITLIPNGSEVDKVRILPKPSTDADGFSKLWRLVEFSRQVLQLPGIIDATTNDQRLTTFTNLAIAMQLAADNISIAGAIPLWSVDDSSIEAEIVDSVTAIGNLLSSWRETEPMSLNVPQILLRLKRGSDGLSSLSYYNARAHSAIASELMEVHGIIPCTGDDAQVKAVGTMERIFSDVTFLSSCEIKVAAQACNQLLSELTALKYGTTESSHGIGLQKLLLLNCLLQRPGDLVDNIPQQRLIFFVQHLVSELDIDKPVTISTEMLRSLHVILPAIKGIYGSFWETTLLFIVSIFDIDPNDEDLPLIHASLRLLSSLRKSEVLEANDDLLDAWKGNKRPLATALVTLTDGLREYADENHQPHRIVNEIIQRQLLSLRTEVSAETEVFYGLLAAPSPCLQQTAYRLLHEIIPSEQEQRSFDKALSKDFIASLPEELLSLVLAVPGPTMFSEKDSLGAIHSSFQSYLLSWLLIFDHWKNASNLLQADYAHSLTEGTYLHDLLTLAFNNLISKQPGPVDASKFDIEAYVPDMEPPQKDNQWLLIHLYYLCLKHLPIQTKNWWRDSTLRHLSQAVESWTEKHFSKLIISSDLNAIKEWAPSQESDEHPMTVKISPSVREITASIPVDEQAMSIVIRLPTSYPLARIEVEGTHRVAVSEQKWNSWLRNAQGQLTIAGEGGGSALIDCLIAWRKNVTAAMKGQTECAICYSVVGADRTLPSKVCKTCKNKFHGSCLFKWFSSSNSSSCPLCRNTFTYS